MRVYKFLSCKYGLKVIRERRLKISEVRSLNDPFDLLPFDLSDPDLRRAVVASRNDIGRDRGLLCFSQDWHNPVLWAHYAESHKGLCLGFDVPDDSLQSITYIEKPIKLTHLDYETANKMLFTKSELYGFSDKLGLAEVVVGAGSPLTKRRILQTLGAYHDGVKIVKASLAYDSFRVVEDEQGFAGVG
jgi:hypothetical protein